MYRTLRTTLAAIVDAYQVKHAQRFKETRQWDPTKTPCSQSHVDMNMFERNHTFKTSFEGERRCSCFPSRLLPRKQPGGPQVRLKTLSRHLCRKWDYEMRETHLEASIILSQVCKLWRVVEGSKKPARPGLSCSVFHIKLVLSGTEKSTWKWMHQMGLRHANKQ